ncbi:MAG: hypothetical protein K2L73_00180, partial [Muribaculaceae bacterium]|nr:hypothetical protein [Muribaculaceae bacterium]
MLTRSDFRVVEAPAKKTRDAKFAYEMYLDTLLLILKLSGRKISPKDEIALPAASVVLPALQNAKMISSLASNTELQELTLKYNRDLSQYADCLKYLADEINDSSAAKDYVRKRKKTIAEDVDFWVVMLQTLLLKDEKFIEAARRNDNFTVAGFESGINMAIDT